MALTIHNIADCKLGILEVSSVAQQAAWGTATADDSNATELSVDAAEFDEDIQHKEGDGALTGTRDDDTINHQATTKYSAPNFELKSKSAFGVLKDELAYYLYAHLQNVTEGEVGTAYSKSFTMHNTQPDFTINAGYFASIIFRCPEASHSIKIKDCIGAAKLAFSMSPGEYLQCSQQWHGRGAVTASSNPSGTWARQPTEASDHFHYNDAVMTIDFGGGAQTITKIGDVSWETTREMLKVGTSTGDFESWMLGPNKGRLTARINFDSNAFSAEANCRNGTLNTVNIHWGTADTDGYFSSTFYYKIKKAARISGDNGIYALDIEGAIVGDIGNTHEMMTVVLCDAQDMGW